MSEGEPVSEGAPGGVVVPGSGDPSGIDPDFVRRPLRRLHAHPGFITVVLLGGIVGTLARFALEELMPTPEGFPLPTLTINLAGAFALGTALEALIRRGPDEGHLLLARLGIGTGFLGAFTTYSTFALESVTAIDDGHLAMAATYVIVSVVGGVLLSFAGIWIASAHHLRGFHAGSAGERGGA